MDDNIVRLDKISERKRILIRVQNMSHDEIVSMFLESKEKDTETIIAHRQTIQELNHEITALRLMIFRLTNEYPHVF